MPAPVPDPVAAQRPSITLREPAAQQRLWLMPPAPERLVGMVGRRVARCKKRSNGLYSGTGAGINVALMKREFSSATGSCSDNTPKRVDIQTCIITC